MAKEVTMQVKVGDKVIFSKYSGTEVEGESENDKLVIVKTERYPGCDRINRIPKAIPKS